MNKDGLKPVKKRPATRSVDGIIAPVVKSPGVASQKPRPRQRTKQVAPSASFEIKKFPLPAYQPPKRDGAVVSRRRKVRKIVLAVSGASLSLILLGGGFMGWRAYANLHKVFRGTSTVAALTSKTVAPSLLKGEGDGRVNILLLGVGGPGHDGPDLSDTMVVLSVDPVNNTAAMVSVPRDLWVKQPVNYFGSYQKINAVYESGKYHYLGKLDATNANANAVEAGFSAADSVMKTVLDVNINYHMLVNFQAFKQAVDTVGGVTVDVPTALVDPTMAWENHNNSVLAPAGTQQMGGVQALMYARSRETTSDFARNQRQRQILIALKDKVLTAGTLSNPAKVDGLMNAFGNNVYSDLSTQGAMRLVSIMKQVGDNKITSIGLADEPHKLVTTDHVGTASVDRPMAGFNNYTDIQSYVRSQLVDGYLRKENASVAVVGPTASAATTIANTLKTYGYNITNSQAGTTGQTPVVVDLSAGKDPYTKNYLQRHYGVKAVTTVPAGLAAPATGTKFVIITAK